VRRRERCIRGLKRKRKERIIWRRCSEVVFVWVREAT